ncbi:MAG: hypothetical protein J7641_09820 [Cyanobacteria bacterium SID2]|nr:hypothetical protein [Cyanobacteria bacterium SID2]MBP0002143.1 hypothetical protein [Cyanobacteria bacterium SBC]
MTTTKDRNLAPSTVEILENPIGFSNPSAVNWKQYLTAAVDFMFAVLVQVEQNLETL